MRIAFRRDDSGSSFIISAIDEDVPPETARVCDMDRIDVVSERAE
jgi:hypothetical protein